MLLPIKSELTVVITCTLLTAMLVCCILLWNAKQPQQLRQVQYVWHIPLQWLEDVVGTHAR